MPRPFFCFAEYRIHQVASLTIIKACHTHYCPIFINHFPKPHACGFRWLLICQHFSIIPFVVLVTVPTLCQANYNIIFVIALLPAIAPRAIFDNNLQHITSFCKNRFFLEYRNISSKFYWYLLPPISIPLRRHKQPMQIILDPIERSFAPSAYACRSAPKLLHFSIVMMPIFISIGQLDGSFHSAP